MSIFCAEYLIYVVLLVIPVLWLGGQNRTARGALLSLGIAWAVGFVIKNLYYLPRPYIVSGRLPLIPVLLDGSFPSNHAIVALTPVFFLIFIRRKPGLWLLPAAFLVAISRVAVGVHTLPDILGGVVISLTVAYIVSRNGAWG